MVSTLDFESSDPSSNLGGTLLREDHFLYSKNTCKMVILGIKHRQSSSNWTIFNKNFIQKNVWALFCVPHLCHICGTCGTSINVPHFCGTNFIYHICFISSHICPHLAPHLVPHLGHLGHLYQKCPTLGHLECDLKKFCLLSYFRFASLQTQLICMKNFKKFYLQGKKWERFQNCNFVISCKFLSRLRKSTHMIY